MRRADADENDHRATRQQEAQGEPRDLWFCGVWGPEYRKLG